MPEMSDANNDKIVVVPQRSLPPSPPPSPSPPPDPAPEPPAPAVAAASRPSRGLAAGDDAFPSAVADDENELPPSYEISTLPRPSDAHVHITVRSNTSASSLPSLTAGRPGARGSINTQGYVLTAPMSHQTTSSRHSASHSHHDDHDPITFYGVEDPWVRHMYSGSDYTTACPCCCLSSCLADGCCFSNRHGCCFSDRGGLCFSDRRGCCFSDHAGCFFSDNGGCFCSSQPGCCCSNDEDERLPVMQSNARSV
ncbi:hypothetical protein TRIATDRAFT_283269 [Trichoderma atroviride IMI 206040]|uniref:Uncharacterized protein n=1 Tax=Hypocrea atroviridis (strain ATCC 20476 / IMI 206040) TaxID=452589 RepID=G9NU82_HYPAI|nr:uncharacterized protein TRIATDRAFT_283269 [Trichoderma atroviride IMI 206040]EHK45615.1 hypothetical protein TRIATDRAFT_283269 [Trichoderma atroviride IMI 206040]